MTDIPSDSLQAWIDHYLNMAVRGVRSKLVARKIMLPIQHLRQTSQEISEEELARLSPVRFEHINVYGKYSFDRPQFLTDEGLRPLEVKK